MVPWVTGKKAKVPWLTGRKHRHSVQVSLEISRPVRPYLFDSSVYAHFWAEDKVGRKGGGKAIEFFYLHLIFIYNPRSVEDKRFLFTSYFQ